MAPVVHSIHNWLIENEKFFVPPICNKLIYKDGQIQAFFVGGPNSRKDFHLEAGEEFFYMFKGDMNLVIQEKGEIKNMAIKEGEVFLLPRCIAHSPRRSANTLGLVIERRRSPQEMDCLRYYTENNKDILYERWFHCDSLDSQLPALIQEFFNSEEHKTGRPKEGSVPLNRPLSQDHQRTLERPFSLMNWIQHNREEIDRAGKKTLFKDKYVTRVFVYGPGKHTGENQLPETFLWNIENPCKVTVEGKEYVLEKDHTMLIPAGERWEINAGRGTILLSVVMDPSTPY